MKIYSKTCQINGAYAFTEMDSLRCFYVSDDTQLTISGKFMTYCPSMEALVASAQANVTYTKDDLFDNCPKQRFAFYIEPCGVKWYNAFKEKYGGSKRL
ncbi:MAG: hypothetical protein IKJ65_12205 [Clostridia bacterium]|nr:hypothetical protein [Clostridia bacterium]